MAAQDRATYVVIIRGWTFVWPHGRMVFVYGYVEYVRRLMGEIKDAHPTRFIPVTGFDDREHFRRWCHQRELW